MMADLIMLPDVELNESERRSLQALYPVLKAQRDAMNRAIDAMRDLDVLEAPSKAAMVAAREIIAGAETRRSLAARGVSSEPESK
jgi:hypothetical protein